jgi:hypothetical protein
MFVKPAPGLIVRDPETREPLPPHGDWVPRTTYWLRRLRDGDVSEAEPGGAAEPAPHPQTPSPQAGRGLQSDAGRGDRKRGER